MTAAPSAANRAAIARPMPWAAPVTMTVFPVKAVVLPDEDMVGTSHYDPPKPVYVGKPPKRRLSFLLAHRSYQAPAESLCLDRCRPFVYAAIRPNSGKSLRLDRRKPFVYASILPNSGKSLRSDRCVAVLNGRYPITKFS
jgi:hypothetical protein